MTAKLGGGAFFACGALVVAAAIALAVTAVVAPPRADATPTYARRTGLQCGQCHVNPNGGGPRTAFGRAFARNGHHLPSSKSRHSTRSRSRSYHRSYRSPSYGYHGGYGMGSGMMGGNDGMGPGMMGGYGR